jgi:hypothetical protein
MIQLRLGLTTLTIDDGLLTRTSSQRWRSLIDAEDIGPNDGYPDYALSARVLARFPEPVF